MVSLIFILLGTFLVSLLTPNMYIKAKLLNSVTTLEFLLNAIGWTMLVYGILVH